MKIKSFQARNTRIMDQFEMISSTCLTKIKKALHTLEYFMETQYKELTLAEKMFMKSFEIIREELWMAFDELFYYRSNKVWLEFIRYVNELDKKLQKSLTNSVKNTLLDL